MNVRQTSHARVLRVTGAVLGAAVVTAVTSAAIAAPANAAADGRTSTTKSIRTIPFTGHGDAAGTGSGGKGTTKANTAVAKACNDGAALIAPQWFAIGKKTTGSLVATADSRAAAGTAVVDHWTGEVLACEGETVARSTRPVDVVAYFEVKVEAGALKVSIGKASSKPTPTPSTPTAPANDKLADAQAITKLPFSTTVDTTLADADGPALKNYSTCELSNLDPVQSNTVWYSYRPATTGAAPVISATPATGWADGNTHGAWAQQAGILEVLPNGGTRLVENEDPWDCETPVTLTAGKNYVIGVFYGSDSYNDEVPVSGGPVKFSVTAR